MAVALRRSLCGLRLSGRCLANNVPVKYLRHFVCNRTFPATKPTLPPPRYSYERMFCSDNRKGFTPNDNEENKVGSSKVLSFNFTSAQGPFGWLSKTVKIWLLKRFFDPEFEEMEFLRGAKQALVVMSGVLSTNQVDELASLASERLIEEMKNRVMGGHKFGTVETGQILSANIQRVQLGYDQDERGKVIEIDVTFFVCKPEGETPPKMTLGNMKVIHLPPPPDIITCTFRRIVFSESFGDWHVTAFHVALVMQPK